MLIKFTFKFCICLYGTDIEHQIGAAQPVLGEAALAVMDHMYFIL